MLYVMSGEDDFSISKTLKELKKSIGDEALLSANTATLDGENLTPAELESICQTVPFMAEKRLVIVRGLLTRFQKKRGRPARRRAPSSARDAGDSYRPFADIIKGLPPSTILVLVEPEVGADNPLASAVRGIAKADNFPLLRGRQLIRWIEKRVGEAGGSISPRARDLLAKLVGGNLWTMSNEIDKLVLFAPGRQIEEEDVALLVSEAREASVFTLFDAIFEGNVKVAQGLLQKLLESGEVPGHLLFTLARGLEFIVRVKDLKSQRKSRDEIQRKLNLADFPYQKAAEQAERHSFLKIRGMYRKLLETDIAIKTGKYGEELALDILTAELCRDNRKAPL